MKIADTVGQLELSLIRNGVIKIEIIPCSMFIWQKRSIADIKDSYITTKIITTWAVP